MSKFRTKISNWDKIRSRSSSESTKFRDVYEDQQLDRSHIKDKQNMVTRIIFSVVVGVLSAMLVYLIFGAFEYYKAIIEFSTENPELSLSDRSFTFFTCLQPTFITLVGSISIGVAMYAICHLIMKFNLDSQNALSDTSDINQYHNDQHIALPEEIQRKFDVFPDVGAHTNVQVSSMISHYAIQNKGLDMVEVQRRAKKDVLNEDGSILYYKGEPLLDKDGDPIYDEMPMIDTDFMEDLYTTSGIALEDKRIRKYYDPTQVDYNRGNEDRDKLSGYDTVADLINGDWVFPDYEPTRPAGVYVVDTAPVNTMVLAITRAGKGQTVIEPTLDMWTRELRPNNAVVNDPKGELLVKFYVKATVRGFQVVQFNLINAMKTDIYNPLGMAAESAREGDFTKCALYVENIADVFFPVDGGDDPVWPNAANNAFKRAAYGLIDYYLEEEKELRLFAERTGMDDTVLEGQLDTMWGKVTLYNCYQLFVQLTSKKLKNPLNEFATQFKNGMFEGRPEDEIYELQEEARKQSILWEDKPESDLLTLFFTATDNLPKNGMRTLVANANNALKAMAGAEKMMSSVYGIAITAMSFFTDPTISMLTSGTPSQNVDLAGMSFPRRLGVRFNTDFVKKYHLTGMQIKWMSYDDKNFTKPLGKDFYHEDIISREGWARYYFKGIFPRDVAYVKLEIINPKTGQLNRTLYFQFKKLYQMSLDSRYYVKDPVLGGKIIKNGILTELKQVPDKKKPGNMTFKRGKTTFTQKKIKDVLSKGRIEKVKTNAITRNMVRYSEKPKMVFLVTPPHLMKYAKLILILLKQLVNLNFDQSYMTKSDQKPLYKTRFMLDELGNLQSDGHGISGFETMLSIGLGQEQQFTLILQTLQQLRDVYGDSVDKIVQGNASNIVFLKSTDDSMIDTLQKMSGTTHKSYISSKSVTQDKKKMLFKNKGEVGYTMAVAEVPVITYNDMAFIGERNSIIFRAGDSPIWNRNEMILPMSWRLFKDTIIQPGKEYTLQTIPTLSSAIDFDVRRNQPDFSKLLDKRMNQAVIAAEAKVAYQEAYDYSDYQIEQLDPDIYADDVMNIINSHLREQNSENAEVDEDFDMDFDMDFAEHAVINKEQLLVNQEEEAKANNREERRYAGGRLSRSNLVAGSNVNHSLDREIGTVYNDIRGDFERDTGYFTVNNGNLCGLDGTVYIRLKSQSEDLNALRDAATNEDTTVYAGEDDIKGELNPHGTYEITDAFYRFLVDLDSWQGFAKGRFETEMAKQLDS